MVITYQAIKDPEFKGTIISKGKVGEGRVSFEGYTLIHSKAIKGHIESINKEIMDNKPGDANEIIFYSVADAKGLRFMRVKFSTITNKINILSDFRYEWKYNPYLSDEPDNEKQKRKYC